MIDQDLTLFTEKLIGTDELGECGEGNRVGC